MRTGKFWLWAMALMLPLAFVTPVGAQDEEWNDEAAAREKKMREREEMERREGEHRGMEDAERRKHGMTEGGPREPGREFGREPGREFGPHQPGHFGPMRPLRPLDEKEIEEVIAWLKEWDPHRLEKMETQREENPEFFMSLLQDSSQEKRKLEGLKSQDPGRYEGMMKERKLEGQCQDLAEKYRKTEDEAQKTTVKTELQVVLGQLFDLREAGREKEVKELEKRLTELRQMVEKRRTNKMQIVDNRLRQMLGEKEFMDW